MCVSLHCCTLGNRAVYQMLTLPHKQQATRSPHTLFIEGNSLVVVAIAILHATVVDAKVTRLDALNLYDTPFACGQVLCLQLVPGTGKYSHYTLKDV